MTDALLDLLGLLIGIVLCLFGLGWSIFWHHNAVYPRGTRVSFEVSIGLALLGVLPIGAGLWLAVHSIPL